MLFHLAQTALLDPWPCPPREGRGFWGPVGWQHGSFLSSFSFKHGRHWAAMMYSMQRCLGSPYTYWNSRGSCSRLSTLCTSFVTAGPQRPTCSQLRPDQKCQWWEAFQLDLGLVGVGFPNTSLCYTIIVVIWCMLCVLHVHLVDCYVQLAQISAHVKYYLEMELWWRWKQLLTEPGGKESQKHCGLDYYYVRSKN